MIRQGDRVQAYYRKSEKLPRGGHHDRELETTADDPGYLESMCLTRGKARDPRQKVSDDEEGMIR
jgi:hypothetical protein